MRRGSAGYRLIGNGTNASRWPVASPTRRLFVNFGKSGARLLLATLRDPRTGWVAPT